MLQRNSVRLWIRRYADQGNIDCRRPGPQAVMYTHESHRHRDIVATHIADPFALTRLPATRHGVSLETVRNHLKAAGLKCRKLIYLIITNNVD